MDSSNFALSILRELKLNENGLIPVVVQEENTNKILMLAYMNKTSLVKTLKSKNMVYWSRKRRKLWKKGKTSGNFQFWKSFYVNCENNALLFKVDQVGAVCHTGRNSCFYKRVNGKSHVTNKKASDPEKVYGMQILTQLFEIIQERKKNPIRGSYTNALLQSKSKISKKLREEVEELISSKKYKGRNGIIWESADLLYHLLVFLAYENIDLADVFKELEKRGK